MKLDWLGVSRTLLVNTTSKAEKTPKELRALYVYLEREEITEGDAFIERLHEIVQTANRNREVRSIMTLAEEMALREELAEKRGREAGLQEGHEARLQEGREAGLKEGHEAGLNEGRMAGRAQEKEAIAIKLKATGMSDAEIADITGLSQKEITALK